MKNHSIGKIYTVGHSNYEIDQFLKIVSAYGIQIIVDVRSSPYSKYCPHFNKEVIEKSLHSADIKYLFLGKELGARPHDPNCYIHGRVDFDFLKQTPKFRKGIERLKGGVRKNCVLAIMCSEKEPMDCHLTILISRVLSNEGIEVFHILNASDTCDQSGIEKKLQKKFKLEPSLFDNENAAAERIDEAYRQQEKKITYESEPKGAEIVSQK